MFWLKFQALGALMSAGSFAAPTARAVKRAKMEVPAAAPEAAAPAPQQGGRLMPTTGGTDPNCNGPFDCHGRGCKATGTRCHSECEGRHLDAIEKTRFDRDFGFQYPREPSVVITASRDMGRTASTWVFNAVRLLYRQAKEACDSYWQRRLLPESLQERLQTGAHVLVKTHEWTGELSQAEFDRVRPMLTHVIVSVRQGFSPDPAWMKVATHVIHYEDIVEHDEAGQNIGALRVLRALAEHLGIEGLTDADFRRVDYDLMTMKMPTGGCDQTTKLWPFHSRRGGRPQPAGPPKDGG